LLHLVFHVCILSFVGFKQTFDGVLDGVVFDGADYILVVDFEDVFAVPVDGVQVALRIDFVQLKVVELGRHWSIQILLYQF